MTGKIKCDNVVVWSQRLNLPIPIGQVEADRVLVFSGPVLIQFKRKESPLLI